jgi:hypothetical protein
MNNQKLDKKVRDDVVRVKKDLNVLVKDSAMRLNSAVDNVYQGSGKAREDLTSRMEDGVSLLSKGIEKITGNARDTLADGALSTVKGVSKGVRQYNSRARKLTDRLSGNFGRRTARTAVIGIVAALAVGFLLGSFLRPVSLPESITHLTEGNMKGM